MLSGREQLARWLERSRLNQRDVSRQLGLHFTVINKILTGRRLPSLQGALAIEALTGVPMQAWRATAVGTRRIRPVREPRKRHNWQAGNAV